MLQFSVHTYIMMLWFALAFLSVLCAFIPVFERGKRRSQKIVSQAGWVLIGAAFVACAFIKADWTLVLFFPGAGAIVYDSTKRTKRARKRVRQGERLLR